jgi:hypothetical protein
VAGGRNHAIFYAILLTPVEAALRGGQHAAPAGPALFALATPPGGGKTLGDARRRW